MCPKYLTYFNKVLVVYLKFRFHWVSYIFSCWIRHPSKRWITGKSAWQIVALLRLFTGPPVRVSPEEKPCTHHIGICTDRLHFSLPAVPERNRSSCWQIQSCPGCAEGPSLNRTPLRQGWCHSEPGHPPGWATKSRSWWLASSCSQVGTEVPPQTPASVPGSRVHGPPARCQAGLGKGLSGALNLCVPQRWTLNTALEVGMRSGQLERAKVKQ